LDRRTRIEPDSKADTSWLDTEREQPQMLAACLKAGRGLVKAPTGAGKGEVIAALVAAIPGPWVVLVHTTSLLGQLAARITSRTGETCGTVGDGTWDPQRATVATFQTLARGLGTAHVQRLLGEARGLIVDECHTASATGFLPVLNATHNAYWRFGFSATPLERGDSRNVLVVGALGEPIYSAREQGLVDLGKLSAPVVRLVPCIQRLTAETWQDAYHALVATSETRNLTIAAIVKGAAKPCLVFVSHLEHGKALKPLLEKRLGVTVRLVHGADGALSRLDTINRMRRGELDVAIATPVFDEGVDIPELASVVVAGAGKSTIKIIQRIGRVKRIAEGKTTCEVWDLADIGNPWLEDHARTRRTLYAQTGHDVRLVSNEETQLMRGRL
jgi:superfamily II DNA or RNA helicase